MKVVYDSQIFCAQTYGGVSRYFCELASHLDRQSGVDVSITAPMHINAYLEHVPPGIVKGFPAPRLGSAGSGYIRLALRGVGILLGDLMLRTMSPDIVHETYFFPYRLGPRKARRVLTIHDMIHEKFPSNFPYADKTAKHKARAAARADHIICVSESTRNDAIDILGLSPDRISVIHHGFDLMAAPSAGPQEEAVPVDGPYLLYVGNRHGYKNFFRLLEAYGTSTNLRSGYKLVCFGGGAFGANEMDAMQRLGLDRASVVQVYGTDQLLSQLYARASVFVYPSLYEGFGMPPLEAMSHDCPVVCGKTSSIPEVVGDAAEYCDTDDVASIRSAIERVVESRSQCEALIQRGRERLKMFSWDRCAAETLAVYRSLV